MPGPIPILEFFKSPTAQEVKEMAAGTILLGGGALAAVEVIRVLMERDFEKIVKKRGARLEGRLLSQNERSDNNR